MPTDPYRYSTLRRQLQNNPYGTAAALETALRMITRYREIAQALAADRINADAAARALLALEEVTDRWMIQHGGAATACTWWHPAQPSLPDGVHVIAPHGRSLMRAVTPGDQAFWVRSVSVDVPGAAYAWLVVGERMEMQMPTDGIERANFIFVPPRQNMDVRVFNESGEELRFHQRDVVVRGWLTRDIA